jgi:endonuclease G, mitochondrial
MHCKRLNKLLFVAILGACGGTGSRLQRSVRFVPHSSGTPETALQAASRPRSMPPFATIEQSPHVAFGVPRDADPSDEVLLDRGEFVLSYSKVHNGPNWVAWRLSRQDLGRVKRKNHFHADLGLPPDLLRVEPEDFGHSGFDRGHLCPSADRTASEAANETTFLMSNMHPQLHALNGGPWEEFEEYSRMLLYRKIDVVYLVAGALYQTPAPKIGRGISVPYASFKVLFAPRSIAPAVPGVTGAGRAVYESVIMPNEARTEGTHWQAYRTSVARVEKASGYDFWSQVPEDPVALPEQVQTPEAF